MLSIYKFSKFIYKYTCKIYEIIFTSYENRFLRKFNSNKDFLNERIFKISYLKNEGLDNFQIFNSIQINQYLNVRQMSNKQVKDLVAEVFHEKIRNEITKITGFCFSVDFMIFYDRKFIPINKREVPTLKQAYSYRWHFDKPNSGNMLKIFLPINITKDHGPLEVLSKNQSKKIKNFKYINELDNRTLFISQKQLLYGFNPTVCCHRDGIPNPNKIASQIMFQLNPHKKWVINSRLFSRCPSLNDKLGIWTSEPKFPFFAYFQDNRISFDII